jgi:hypothetical protein
MNQNLTIQQLAAAACVTRTTIDQWISRGHFRPSKDPEIGKAREFTLDDAVALGALAELVRIGMSPAVAAMHVIGVHQFSDDETLLVVTQGPAGSSGSSRISATMYDPANPSTFSEFVRARDLIKIATDPDVRSMSVVNLSQVAGRVLKTIGNA